MANHTPNLTDQDVLRQAQTQLEQHLPLKAAGYLCSSADLYRLLLGISATRNTLEAECADLDGAPHANTVRGYLNEQLTVDRLEEVEQQLNAALAAEIPARVWHGPRDMAIDYHDQAYYGKTSQADGLWIRAAAKDGTTHFYRVASAYVMLKQLRVTLAVRFVRPEDATVVVLRRLLKRLKTLKIQARKLFLDRGFAGVRVIRFLRKLRQPALIACPIRGKQGGTRALCTGRQSYRTTYTFHSPADGQATVELAVCRTFTTAKRTGRHGRQADWMIFILIELDCSPKHARQQYRRRFGIESSYRCARSVRGWTTANNPVYRFLLIGLSFFLLNVWIHLRWSVARVARRGYRALRSAHFRLRRFARFIALALEDLYSCVRAIPVLSPRYADG